VLVQPDGKIVLAGAGRADLPLWVARLNPNGSFDAGFGGDGTSGAAGLDGQTAALQPDGKIVVVGHKSLPDDVAVARFQPGGTLDTTFSSDGKTTVDFGGEERGNGVALQPDGRIVVVGYTDFDSVAARLQGDPRPSGGGGAGGPGGRDRLRGGAGRDRCLGGRDRDRARCEIERSA
jgi:uncharacterized delta-60 repeat protein